MQFQGHDTTTSGLAFGLYNIAKYPEVQKKVIEEIRAVIGDDPNEMVSMKQLNDLNYLELVIKESLRLFPSVPLYGRKVLEEFDLSELVYQKLKLFLLYLLRYFRW